jgi:hypothetical protein
MHIMNEIHLIARAALAMLAVSITIASGLLFQFGHLS